MARKPNDTDFIVKAPGIGTFTFARRTMRDEIAIQVEFARIIDGVEPTSWLQAVGGWISVFRVLTVRAPEEWDIDGMDPTDPETYAKMRQVYEALSEKEGTFRRKPEPSSEAVGARTAPDDRV